MFKICTIFFYKLFQCLQALSVIRLKIVDVTVSITGQSSRHQVRECFDESWEQGGDQDYNHDEADETFCDDSRRPDW